MIGIAFWEHSATPVLTGYKTGEVGVRKSEACPHHKYLFNGPNQQTLN
jgi:hypothetical protein